jgi:hypothetical protein
VQGFHAICTLEPQVTSAKRCSHCPSDQQPEVCVKDQRLQ